ncbi:MAG: xylulokinase [Clostridia bacterium]|nr:xylulokinase [Clostridia bacterium]MBO5416042.1 xylulokinase [Clostridia bacterium]
MRYLIGIDIGTSGTKTVLFDENGKNIRQKTVEYPMSQPKNGWAEQDPDDWYNAVLETLKYVSEGVEGISGIGFSGQMHGLVMLDGDGRVIRPSIIWCDQRTGKECEEITERVGKERLVEITANPALTGFTASKILWVRNNEPENYKKCKHILLPKDYIRYRLTGEFATDVSDASGMQLLDVAKRDWSDEVLEKLDIDKSLLARVYESCEVTGYVKNIGILEGVPVVAGAGDNAAAAVGSGTVTAGKAFTTIGTSGVVYAHTDAPVIDKAGRVHTFCCAVPNKWHVMGVTQGAGLSLKWFRSNFAPELSYKEIDKIAEGVSIGADKLLYLPYLMGERTPHLDPNARGTFVGISAIHEKKHFLRAVMEGVSYSLRDCLEVLYEMGIPVSEMLAVGGGGTSAFWRRMLCDLYNMQTKTIVAGEGACLGAAILAGVGTGVYPSVEEACDSIISYSDPEIPSESAHAEYEKSYAVYRNVYKGLKDTFSALSEL